MKTLTFEIQTTGKGDAVSWRWFRFKKLTPPSAVETKFGLTVDLSDAITAIVRIAGSLDPNCRVSLDRFSGFLFPEFTISILSEKFEIAAEKVFAGGASRENIFNYRVHLTMRSPSEAVLKLLSKSYKELGPKPLKECFEENGG
jgi:hypothetical protein